MKKLFLDEVIQDILDIMTSFEILKSDTANWVTVTDVVLFCSHSIDPPKNHLVTISDWSCIPLHSAKETPHHP